MGRFELKFLDGPGESRSIDGDAVHSKVWLCNADGIKWWTFTMPERPWVVEAEYSLLGQAPRPGERHLLVYGVKEEDAQN